MILEWKIGPDGHKYTFVKMFLQDTRGNAVEMMMVAISEEEYASFQARGEAYRRARAREAFEANAEKIRKAREEQEKMRREAEEAKQAWADLNERLRQHPFTFTSTFNTGFIFRDLFDDPPPAPKREAPKVKPKGGYLEQLCVLAKVDFPTTLEPKVVYRKAMRHCHPDHGGTSEQWHEMEYLGRRLGLTK